MVKENMTVKKSRYISISVGGMEIYTENVSASGSMLDHVPAAKIRLREIERVMPLGKWSIRIEQQWREKDARQYQWVDVVTGKIDEKVIF